MKQHLDSGLSWLRSWLLRLWLTKGGGFYGLGYVVTFVVLELRSFTSDIGGSGSFAGFIASQAIQYVIRLSIESILNAFMALIWPVRLIAEFGVWGLFGLAGGFLAFEYALRPVAEVWFPELSEARAAAARSKRSD